MSNPSDIAIMLDDPNLVRLVASWPKIEASKRTDMDFVSAVSGVLRCDIESVVLRAKTHGLVFDNGTVNEFAQKYLNALVAERLQKVTKGRK